MTFLPWQKLTGVFLLSLILSITLQIYIGNANIYFSREASGNSYWVDQHEGVLRNQLPNGKTWDGIGMNGVNIRIGVVYFADWISKFIRWPIMKTYRWIDNCFLVATFFFLYFVLELWLGSNRAFIGVFYYAFSQITSYFPLHWHPWDRPSHFLWLLSLFLLFKKRDILLWLIVMLGMLIKYDLIMISGVYFLANISKTNWRKPLVVSCLLFFSCASLLWLLIQIFPGGFPDTAKGESHFSKLIAFNIQKFLEVPLAYPPLLVFSLPLLLGFWGWKKASQFEKSGYLIGSFALPGYFCTSYFGETRAEMPLLLMILPCALRAINQSSTSHLNH